MESAPDPDALPQPSVGLVQERSAPADPATAAGLTSAAEGEPRPAEWRPREPRRPPRLREPRPDHFLALRMSHSPSVTATLAAIHTSITQHSPSLAPSIVDPASAHITVGVLNLPDVAAREAAAAALRGAAAAAAMDGPCALTLRGLGNFKNEVVWLGVGADGGGDAALAALAATIRGTFREAGLLLQADREFTPHVTVAKLSKMQSWGGGGARGNWKRHRGQGRGRGSTSGLREVEDASAAAASMQEASPSQSARLTIPPEAYAAHTDVAAAVEIAELQLCAMAGRRPGRYYTVVASCSLLASDLEEKSAGEDAGDAPL
jgi:2'-5' RNA ligase